MLKLKQLRAVTSSDKLIKSQTRFGFNFSQTKTLGWVILAYLALTAIFTFPLIFNFNTALPGQLLEDRDQNLWNLWWVKEAVLNFRNPFRTDYIYYPDGVSLYFHTLNPLNGFLSIPVQMFFGVVAAYNFIVFFSFVMAGLGSYLLLVYLCQNRLAAFVASLIFVFAPYHLGTLKGLLQLISLEWLPFYVLYLLKATATTATRRQRLFYSLLAALFLGFTALTDWYYTLFLIGFSGLYFIWSTTAFLASYYQSSKWRLLLLTKDPQVMTASKALPSSSSLSFSPQAQKPIRPGVLLARLWPFGLIVALFVVGIGPVLLPMWREMNNTTYYLPDPQDTRKYSADLLAFFLPPSTSSLFGWVDWKSLDLHYLTGPLAAPVYLGYSALSLAILGLVVNKSSRGWGISAFCFWVLSLGPALRVNGPQPGWGLPYALLENWPIVKIMRSPDRFVVITMLGLAVCASFGLKWLVERIRQKGPGTIASLWRGRIGLGLIAGLILAEFVQLPYPINPYQISPFFEQLGRDPQNYAILELPPQGGLWSGAPRMAEQTVHHKRIFDGYISREYDHPFERNVPGFRELVTLKFNSDVVKSIPPEDSAGKPGAIWYTALNYYHVRYIILRSPQTAKQSASTDLASYRVAIKRMLGDNTNPFYQDDQVEVYAVPPVYTIRPFVEIGEGWYEPERTAVAGEQEYHRWAWGKASLNLVWPGAGTKNVNLSLTLGLLQGEKAARVVFNGSIVWAGQLSYPVNIKVPLTLNPGKNLLEVQVDGKPATPSSLGLGNDLRRLLYYVSNVSLE